MASCSPAVCYFNTLLPKLRGENSLPTKQFSLVAEPLSVNYSVFQFQSFKLLPVIFHVFA
jgi:hypothetical protein